MDLELEISGLNGFISKLTVPSWLTGHELHGLVAQRLAPIFGAGGGEVLGGKVCLLQHREKMLEFQKTLEEQGLAVASSCLLSYVYVPVKIYSLWKLLAGSMMEEKEQEEAWFALGAVKKVVGISMNQQIRGLHSLEDLTYRHDFDELPQLPESLQRLTFGSHFNRSLRACNLPKLLMLTFGADFNQSLTGVQLPKTLRFLTFGRDFNQPLEAVSFPSDLETLSFGANFNQSLEAVNLPQGLETLSFGDHFNQSLVHLPERLQDLSFGNNFNQSLECLALPRLKSLALGYHFRHLILPWDRLKSLRHLALGGFSMAMDISKLSHLDT